MEWSIDWSEVMSNGTHARNGACPQPHERRDLCLFRPSFCQVTTVALRCARCAGREGVAVMVVSACPACTRALRGPAHGVPSSCFQATGRGRGFNVVVVQYEYVPCRGLWCPERAGEGGRALL